jgi:hypothetical protein
MNVTARVRCRGASAGGRHRRPDYSRAVSGEAGVPSAEPAVYATVPRARALAMLAKAIGAVAAKRRGTRRHLPIRGAHGAPDRVAIDIDVAVVTPRRADGAAGLGLDHGHILGDNGGHETGEIDEQTKQRNPAMYRGPPLVG